QRQDRPAAAAAHAIPAEVLDRESDSEGDDAHQRRKRDGRRGGAILALGMVAAGMGLAGWAATVLTVGAALVAAAVLGAGYG
ncbi:hypothetical protein C6A85_11335, partial [Mycobacterium sp. ITM-2017-0098]